MQFRFLARSDLPLDKQLTWLWYSSQLSSFIVGDDRQAFAIATATPSAATPLVTGSGSNLPIPDSLYDEFAGQSWHGFRFLNTSFPKSDGDLVRTVVFGPDYGHQLLHPPSKKIFRLRAGSIEMLETSANGYKSLDKTKTRGRAALAFAAHPTESTIAYGDNFGEFHAQPFDATKFTKASKIAAKERNATRLEFFAEGKMLAIGGMGYLATYSFAGGKFTAVHDLSIVVRDFLWLSDGALVLVNQGLHGISAYRYDAAGFTKLGAISTDGAAQQIAISKCQRYLAVTLQASAGICVYEIGAA